MYLKKRHLTTTIILLTGILITLARAASEGTALPAPLLVPELDPQTPGQWELRWETTPGKLYGLEVSADLESWSMVAGFPLLAEGNRQEHLLSEGTDNQYFRIRESAGHLPLLNRQSGISVGLSGTNGTDWLVEHSFHDASISDQVIYLHQEVAISLYHNANNSILKPGSGLPQILGTTGKDGIPDSGDEGDIHWKVDRDMQNHRYNHADQIPDWAPLYSEPIQLDALTYDGVLPVLGTTGDNGADWGSSPIGTQERFAYGQTDAFGNEWHTLTYWDDDEPVYAAADVSSHRQGASDGHWIYICVNPVTPVLQFSTDTIEEQFYTTPIKTYHVPKTWEQTTYATSGVFLAFYNLNNDAQVQYRIDGGPWQEAPQMPVRISDIVSSEDQPVLLEYRNGPAGAAGRRTIVMNPSIPGAEEIHGYLLWANDTEREAVIGKLANLQPFARSYNDLKGETNQLLAMEHGDAREGWRSGAAMASAAMNNAYLANLENVEGVHATNAAIKAKERLLRLARLEAVGFEQDINQATPAKDYMNELGQTIQQYADAAVAYDLLAACFRQADHPDGITPIEEIRIRDGLGEIAKNLMQMRANWTFTIGGGNTHWAHGYELALGIIAAAMPSYSTPYFGVSGGDFTSVNDFVDKNGEYWNPFPNQGITWWAAATDPHLELMGHPNVKAPMRAESLLTDNGYWTGPNEFQGDGNRYFAGVTKRQLVDLNYGGMANAECRVELVEMDGYEYPFVGRLHVLDFIRRIRGDNNRQLSVTNYIRRRQLGGHIPLTWDATNNIYSAEAPRAVTALLAFNDYYEAASLPSAITLVSTFLTDVNRYYGYESGTAPSYISSDRKVLQSPYELSLCWDPAKIGPHQPEDNHAPIVKPLLKHVVHAGEQVHKELLIVDPDDDAITVTVMDLPEGAVFNNETRTISWFPTIADEGVHIATVTADDGVASTSVQFPMIVKSDAPSGPIPPNPLDVEASLSGNDAIITWTIPDGVNVAGLIIWRDGIPAYIAPPDSDTWTDFGLPPGSHTRYHVSVLATNGAESYAVVAEPGYLATE